MGHSDSEDTLLTYIFILFRLEKCGNGSGKVQNKVAGDDYMVEMEFSGAMNLWNVIESCAVILYYMETRKYAGGTSLSLLPFYSTALDKLVVGEL